MFLDTQKIAEEWIERLAKRVAEMPKKRVAFVSFMNTTAGESFLSRKTEIAERLKIETSILRHSPKDTEDAKKFVQSILTEGYDGVIIQLPLPKGIQVKEILDLLPRRVDIDMLSAEAKEAYKKGETKRVPPVARAVYEVLTRSGVDYKGKNILVLGRGRLVGEPVADMLSKLGCLYRTVDGTTAEEDVRHLIAEADVVVSGIGKPHFIKPDMVKDGSLLIDAGTSGEAGEVLGDVSPECSSTCLVTPVPGGVGPLAVLGLFQNLTEE